MGRASDQAAQDLVSRVLDAKPVANIAMAQVLQHDSVVSRPMHVRSYKSCYASRWGFASKATHAHAATACCFPRRWESKGHHQVADNSKKCPSCNNRTHTRARVMNTSSFFLRAWLSWQEDGFRARSSKSWQCESAENHTCCCARDTARVLPLLLCRFDFALVILLPCLAFCIHMCISFDVSPCMARRQRETLGPRTISTLS